MFNISMLLSPAVKLYIVNVLDEEEQVWFTKNLISRPLGLGEYLLSMKGQEAVKTFFKSYREYASVPALYKPVSVARE